MALPGNHLLPAVHQTALCTSVGSTPVAVYFDVPFRARIGAIASILNGAITVANAACAVAINGGSTSFTHTIVQSGSAAGQRDTTTPASPTYVSQGDVISITPSGATGTNVQAFFRLSLVPA